MEYIPVRVSDIIRQVNRDIYLPAIQREFVWGTDRIERLFDSIMADFPIGSFLYWRLEQKNKDEWPVYEFIREYDAEAPHNSPANMAGITKDITLVLDGQQRITSLFIGLRGCHRNFYYRWRKTRLYLNLLKPPVPNEENPEELTYGFAFRESADTVGETPQVWYQVGRILDFEDAEDAKSDMKSQLAGLTDEQRENANKLIGRLHNRIHTTLVGNYYQEKSQDYDKVLQVFVRANSAGQPLEYSDLLLATATAKWETLDARSEIHEFTDSLNDIGTGYGLGKDFVLKASLYLTENLPIQYRVKNFSRSNLRKIEANWGNIKEALATTIRLISRFGFNSKNVVAPLALLPIAFYLLKRGNRAFDTSSKAEDAEAQVAIRKWFVFSTLKNAFGGSSDTTLTRLRELLKETGPDTPFPADTLYKSLGIEPRLNDAEIERIVGYAYQGRYTNLVLSLLYPDRDWKDAVFHEDHIFPQSEFNLRGLRKRKYDERKIEVYLARYNTLCNLQLLTESENLSKNATPFDEWFRTRDTAFRKRHLIPELPDYSFDSFEDFSKARTELIVGALKAMNDSWHGGTELSGNDPLGEAEDDEDEEVTSEVSVVGTKGRDYTKFDVEIKGTKHEALSKRKAVLTIVKHLCDQGVKPEEIAETVPWRSNLFCSVDGTVTSDQFVTQQKAKVDSGGKRRFFCDEGDLIYCAERTYAVTNGWGNRTFQAIQNILANYPDHGVKCDKHTCEAKPVEVVATSKSWEIQPMPKNRQRIDFQRTFTNAEFAKIKSGFVPLDMDDRWFVYFEDGVMYIHRSWSGNCIFQVRLSSTADGWRVEEAWASRDETQYQTSGAEQDIQMLSDVLGWTFRI